MAGFWIKQLIRQQRNKKNMYPGIGCMHIYTIQRVCTTPCHFQNHCLTLSESQSHSQNHCLTLSESLPGTLRITVWHSQNHCLTLSESLFGTLRISLTLRITVWHFQNHCLTLLESLSDTLSCLVEHSAGKSSSTKPKNSVSKSES